MKAAVVIFPGSNCDRDMMVAFERAAGVPPIPVWHKETELPEGVDLVGVPGGFSYGDYLRCGAIAARAPIMRAVAEHAARGGYVLGVCNGWQILIEAGLLPGALMRNANLKFLSKSVLLRVERNDTRFTTRYGAGDVIDTPIAHHDGAFMADAETRARLFAENLIAFRYVDALGQVTPQANPNGSIENAAGVLSPNLRVLGMMPHPERAADPAHSSSAGAALFESLLAA